MIIEFCRRQISFCQDRLLALAGIGKIFAAVTGYRWAAGLWKEHMPLALLWEAVPSADSHINQGFPSWSWASAGNPQGLFFRPMKYGARIVAEVLDVKCATVTEDPFSLLSGAQLSLRALTVPLAVETNTGRIGLKLHETVVFPQVVKPDRIDKAYELEPLLRGRYSDARIPDEYRFSDRVTKCTSTSEDNVTISEPASVAAIIYTHAYRSGQSTTILTVGGLLLEPNQCAIDGGLPPTYRRFGVFECVRWKVPSFSLPLHPDLFSISEHSFESDLQTDAPFDFDNVTCLENLTIV